MNFWQLLTHGFHVARLEIRVHAAGPQALAHATLQPGGGGPLPEGGGHEGAEGAVHLRAAAELVEVAPGLGQDQVAGHGEGEGVEEDHELVNIHLFLDCSLSIYGHDGYAYEEVEGGSFTVSPAGFPYS